MPTPETRYAKSGAVNSAYHRRVRAELARFRGEELDTAGDWFFAAYDEIRGFLSELEAGRPARAVRCACAIRAALADLGLDIRAGLHTGECEVLDGKVAGLAVSIGARVAPVPSRVRCWCHKRSGISWPARASNSPSAESPS